MCGLSVCVQLYDMSPDPKRKEFLDDLFSFMQKRGQPPSLLVHSQRFDNSGQRPTMTDNTPAIRRCSVTFNGVRTSPPGQWPPPDTCSLGHLMICPLGHSPPVNLLAFCCQRILSLFGEQVSGGNCPGDECPPFHI